MVSSAWQVSYSIWLGLPFTYVQLVLTKGKKTRKGQRDTAVFKSIVFKKQTKELSPSLSYPSEREREGKKILY